MERKIEQINWEEYADIFPERYLQGTKFDDAIRKIALELDFSTEDTIKVLDVGGGRMGTQILLELDTLETYFLDPNISETPKGMVRFNQFGSEKFDLVVARNSVNYFPPFMVKNLTTYLKPGGILIANTFIEAPKSRTRKFRNESNDSAGIERIEMFEDPEGNKKIKHELIPLGQDRIIKHEFFQYRMQDILKLFVMNENLELSFHPYSLKSYYFKIKKRL